MDFSANGMKLKQIKFMTNINKRCGCCILCLVGQNYNCVKKEKSVTRYCCTVISPVVKSSFLGAAAVKQMTQTCIA